MEWEMGERWKEDVEGVQVLMSETTFQEGSLG